MIDLEKVIKGLECAIDPKHNGFMDCHACAYRKNVDHLQYVCDGDRCIMDALALLKAQEPRVMTLEEANDADVCWAEGRDGWDATPPRRMSLWNWNEVRLYRFASEEYVSLKPNEYGKTWRCWTSRPTEEQREAVKWDE